jgi:RNA recognition motif-containing protein
LNKKAIAGGFLIVNYLVTKKENENYKQRPIAQNLQETYSSNIYVKHIPADVTEEKLKEVFSDFSYYEIEVDATGQRTTTKKEPAIVSIKMGTQKGKDTKFAYILYQTVGASQRAMQLFDGNNPFGGIIPLKVDIWQSKDDHEREKKRRETNQTN